MPDEPLSQEAIEALLAGPAEPAPADPLVGALVSDALDQAAAPAAPVIEEVELDALLPLEERGAEQVDVGMLLDVPLTIAVELGRARLTIRDLLELGQGSILELDRHAGEPVDVLVNGKPLARGEVVVIDEDFGIRVTEVVSPEDRLRSMGR